MPISAAQPLPCNGEVFGIGAGRCVTVRQYVAAIKKVMGNRDARFNTGLRGEWWPVTGEEIMREFMRYVHDAINLRGGMVTGKTPTDAKLLKMKRAHIVSKCKWCGRSLGSYKLEWQRFCDASCRRSYC